MKKTILLLILILLSGCTFVDRKGGEYKFTLEKNKLNDQVIIDKCSVPTGFACLAYSAKTNGVSITLKNSMGKDMEDFYIAVDCGKSNSTTMENGDIKEFFVPCKLEKDTQYESELYIIYKDSFSGLDHTDKGKLMARVK